MQFYIVLMHLSSKISSCIYLWVFSSLPFLHTACISRVVGPHQVIITFSSSLFGMITHDYTLTFITFGVLCNCLLLWSNNRTRMCLSLNNAAFSVFSIFPLFQFPLCKQHFSFFFVNWVWCFSKSMVSISELQKMSAVSFDKAVHNLIRDFSFPDAENGMKDMMAALFLVSHCFTLGFVSMIFWWNLDVWVHMGLKVVKIPGKYRHCRVWRVNNTVTPPNRPTVENKATLLFWS